MASSLHEDDELLESDDMCKLIMAHNGWVFGDDPMKNFAEAGKVARGVYSLVCLHNYFLLIIFSRYFEQSYTIHNS